ncbi:MAG TPA: XrtA system polysaccharide deacetylase [Candidatus Acidoferrum sp.]|jgi:polysaccharide deacetylase family protein (PEP-CTERM system associated)|nr:XrtA system polysaccharide deacetylase [Candidatus Acidoferrum sp.]
MSEQGRQLMAMRGTPTNCITVDVEDYFHTEAMAGTVRPDQWDQFPSRVEHNTRRIFELFQSHNVRGTFFFLGWVAERFPGLVREAVQLGHEIGCHSYWHRLVYRLTPEQFREDTERAKGAIEEAAGKRVLGYRAPSFSMVKGTEWAMEILGNLGFCYDSSIFPIKHDLYGNASAPRIPHLIADGRLIEFPVAALAVASHNFPVGGGGYFRILPYAYTRWGLRRLNGREKLRSVIYIHPWELDPEQPQLAAPARSRFRQYTGLQTTARKLERLLRDFHFAPIVEAFSGELRSSLSHTENLADREIAEQWALAYEQIGTK